MRTTLNIDADVLHAAMERARREGLSIGEFVSRVLRASFTVLAAAQSAQSDLAIDQPRAVYGFRPFPKRGGEVTNEHINKLRESGIY